MCTLFLQIKSLEERLSTHEEDKQFMEGLIAKFADEKDDLANRVERGDIDLDEFHSARIEMEKELEDTQLRLQVGK